MESRGRKEKSEMMGQEERMGSQDHLVLQAQRVSKDHPESLEPLELMEGRGKEEKSGILECLDHRGRLDLREFMTQH